MYLVAFKTFSLSSIFSICHMCVCVIFFVFILFGCCWGSWFYKLVFFNKPIKMLAKISLGCLFVVCLTGALRRGFLQGKSLCFPSRTSIKSKWECLLLNIVSQIGGALAFFFKSFFFVFHIQSFLLICVQLHWHIFHLSPIKLRPSNDFFCFKFQVLCFPVLKFPLD